MAGNQTEQEIEAGIFRADDLMYEGISLHAEKSGELAWSDETPVQKKNGHWIFRVAGKFYGFEEPVPVTLNGVTVKVSVLSMAHWLTERSGNARISEIQEDSRLAIDAAWFLNAFAARFDEFANVFSEFVARFYVQ